MKTIHQHIRTHLLADVPERLPGLDELRRTERSPEFERLRMNRKIIGAMRYGRMSLPDKPKYNRVLCMLRRLNEYAQDRNAEHLVDVANLAELEFVEGDHHGVQSTDDGEHTREA